MRGPPVAAGRGEMAPVPLQAVFDGDVAVILVLVDEIGRAHV